MMRRRRLIMLIVLLLVGGVVVNVGVTWGALLLVGRASDGIYPAPFRTAMPSVAYEHTEHQSTPDLYGSIQLLGQNAHFWRWYGTDGIAGTAFFATWSFGWPARSVSQSGHWIHRSPQPIPVWDGRFHESVAALRTYWPVRPIWPGFAINTFFYATILALPLLGFVGVRRVKRSRRGACLTCAYDLSATPIGNVCPECGASRSTNN